MRLGRAETKTRWYKERNEVECTMDDQHSSVLVTRNHGFKVVSKVAEQSPGTVRNAIATCPYPNCGATTPRDYISQEAQAGRLGHQLYCIIYRDQWWPKTKSGKPRKRPKTRRGFRLATPEDDNSPEVAQWLKELKPQWDAEDVLPGEAVPERNDNRPHNYGMSPWRNMFSPRQQLAHGHCVQAFRELVDEYRDAGVLDDTRKAAWCSILFSLGRQVRGYGGRQMYAILEVTCLRSG